MSGSDEAPLLSAAEKISSGVAVDWNEIQSQIATPDQAAVVEELRSLEQFAKISGQAPATWGRFHIVSEIGRGTFGTVYCAIDPTLQLEVALKVIRSRVPGPIDKERALEEARRLVKVKHPNVVRAYGAELIDNEVGLSMEIVKGHTLDEIVRRQAPFSANEATVIGVDLCRALAAVHGCGILHGDIKAHNVMRENGGRTVLMDFGTGRHLNRPPSGSDKDFAGTPLYLAPEVFDGHPRTPTTEIYSLGVLLYFLVTGSYPVEGDSRTEIKRLHDRSDRRKPLRDVRPDLPDGFIRVVERATAERPEDRYGSAGELETALARVLSPPIAEPMPVPVPGPNPPSDWRKLVLVAASIVLVVGVAAMTVPRILQRLSAPSVSRSAAITPDVAVASSTGPATAPGTSPYRIESAFYRESKGRVERLKPGDKLAPGDALSLQVQASIPMYFYVVNEDERGHSFLLFPLPGQTMQNPLPPGQRHRLPSAGSGELLSWEVTTTGLREHFLLVASPERSTAFDELFATLPQPAFGRATENAKLSVEAIGVLRGVGGLTVSPAQVDRQLRLMPEFSTPLTESEEPGQGVWIRHATFVNPDK
jgi:eukaryotic-like serine/threonine-protein kinase